MTPPAPKRSPNEPLLSLFAEYQSGLDTYVHSIPAGREFAFNGNLTLKAQPALPVRLLQK